MAREVKEHKFVSHAEAETGQKRKRKRINELENNGWISALVVESL